MTRLGATIFILIASTTRSGAFRLFWEISCSDASERKCSRQSNFCPDEASNRFASKTSRFARDIRNRKKEKRKSNQLPKQNMVHMHTLSLHIRERHRKDDKISHFTCNQIQWKINYKNSIELIIIVCPFERVVLSKRLIYVVQRMERLFGRNEMHQFISFWIESKRCVSCK